MRAVHTSILICVQIACVPVTGMAAEAVQLQYFPPGDILPKTVTGDTSRHVEFPDWSFPMEVGGSSGFHAYIGTQLSQYHGVKWANDPRLYSYPSRDNQCEPRDWKMLGCPSGKGHQGVDIRANDNRDNVWDVVAVEGGVVTSITKNTTVQVRNGNHTVRYLHMHPLSITAAGIKIGSVVTAGQRLGKVSCYMGGACQTSRHLHFDAYRGAASQGGFYHVYPSLIAAYRRAWGLESGVHDGALAPDNIYEVGDSVGAEELTSKPTADFAKLGGCEGIALADPLPDIERSGFKSLWVHNCSIMGLTADQATGARSFTYYRPKKSISEIVGKQPVLFRGISVGDAYKGVARQYSVKCGDQEFEVEGGVISETIPTVLISGNVRRRNSDCVTIRVTKEELKFTFVETVSEETTAREHTIPEGRERLSEVTRNFMAITFYPSEDGSVEVLPYFAEFPGIMSGVGEYDSRGGFIPSLRTDEAGVAISRVWIRKRARFTNGLSVTPRTVAHSMAGVEPGMCDNQVVPTSAGISAAGGLQQAKAQCDRVSAYLRGYVGFGGGHGFAESYFGRAVGLDDIIDLSNADAAWNWMRTMYSHESGRPAVIDRATFERGQQLGDDYVAAYYDNLPETLRSVEYYSDPCNFHQSTCGSGDKALVSLEVLQERLEELGARVLALEKTLASK